MAKPTEPIAELIVATNNTHKVRELSRLFAGFSLHLPAGLGCRFSYEETGTRYLDNALGKAMHLYGLVERPVLADDSGLEVPGLDGEPGIYSSRYGSPGGGRSLTDSERNAYLLRRAAGLSDRSCFFVCCMVVILEPKRFFLVQETMQGVLAAEPAGSGGFGYDPVVFIPELGRTVAQLSDTEKNRLSHRGRAARRLLSVLRQGNP